jgi:hypothetical protein
MCPRKFLFMMEILISVSIDEKKMNWPKKKPHVPFHKAVKSKVIFRSIFR